MKREDLLKRAERYWLAMAGFRRRRDRCKQYAFGNQWGDIVEVDGERMTEEAFIRREGATPLKNNLINRFLRNVLGVYRSQRKEPVCVARDRTETDLADTMSTVLQYNWQLNKMEELLATVMKEFLISGAAIVRKSWGWRNGKSDCWTDIVSPTRFFVDDTMRDIRGWDIRMAGELKDLPYDELLAEFGTDEAACSEIERIYRSGNADGTHEFGATPREESFLAASEPGFCRVIEVWTRERRPVWHMHDRRDGTLSTDFGKRPPRSVERENRGRSARGEPLIELHRSVDEGWVYRCLAPDGTVLREINNPYCHASHPYVFRFHPFIDGEVHSFVNDIIDQQRYVNRLITLYDWTVRASAKGVLLFPQECLPDGMTLDDVGEQWARYNGILPIRHTPGRALPQQVTGGAANAGIHDLLGMQLKFFEDISGVSGALQGKPGFAGMSASLYAQQTQNSTLSLLDILESFSDFVKEGACKDVKNIQQFYDYSRVVTINGVKGTRRVTYNPDRIRNVEFDLAITEGMRSAAYRQMANESLEKLWNAGAITAEQYLRYGDFPYTGELLSEMKLNDYEEDCGIDQGALPRI